MIVPLKPNELNLPDSGLAESAPQSESVAPSTTRPSTSTGIRNAAGPRQERRSDTTCAFNLRASGGITTEEGTHVITSKRP